MPKIKQPAESIELEQTYLACLLVGGESAYSQSRMIIDNPRAFNDSDNKKIFKAILSLYRKSQDIDLVTVGDELLREGVDLRVKLADISCMITTATHVVTYAEKLRDYWIRREIVLTAEDVATRRSSEADTAQELISTTMESIAKLQGLIVGSETVEANAYAVKFMNDVDQRAREGQSVGIPTNIESFDRWVGGLLKGKLHCFAARPSVGKSDAMINMIIEIASNVPVLVISAEMDRDALINRMIANFNNVNSLDLIEGKLTLPDEWYAELFGNRKIYIDDKPSPSVLDIRAVISTEIARHKIGCVFIDHLHELHFTPTRSGHLEDVRATVKGIRDLSRLFRVPIVILQQLSRDGGRSDRPKLIHLRDAGEEFYDVVVGLWREKYGDQQPFEGQDRMEWLILKARGGRTGRINMLYELKSGRQSEDPNQFDRDYDSQEENVF